MNFYALLKPLLFQLDAELAHGLSLNSLAFLHRSGFKSLPGRQANSDPRSVMGLNFPNPIGLAAGLDKNGDYIDALAMLGFGFLEVGTVTPRPQHGNPKPRLFRLPQAKAIINRLGFNNKGIDYLLDRIKHAAYNGILGINLGKNFDTPIENAVSDYVIGLRKAYPFASYITINISSPNTQNLRQLQKQDAMKALLERLKNEQRVLYRSSSRFVPLLVKVAPDLNDVEIDQIAERLLEFEIDGVIATNTSISREAVQGLPYSTEAGGLSGAPLFDPSTKIVRSFYSRLQDKIPIIAAGGIMNGANATEKFEAGATLIQVYSGLVYRGPDLIREITNDLAR